MDRKNITITVVCMVMCLILLFSGSCTAVDNHIDVTEEVNEQLEVQDHAHQMADHARALDIPENDPIIVKAGQIWQDAQNRILAYQYLCEHFTTNDYYYMSKTIKAEANGNTVYQLSNVGWCIMNRVDINGKTICAIVTQPNQFAYSPFKDGNEYLYMAKDVIFRYCMEKIGAEDVGRTLPNTYVQFRGNGKINVYYENFNDAQAGRNPYTNYLKDPYVG